jgi:DNA polymerase-3 subunit beta
MIGHDGSDYPGIPSFEGSQQLDIPAEVLQRAIQKTGFAVSKDALRPAMMGILFQIRNNGTQVVATDGHRLVRLTLKRISSPDPLEFIVPSKALSLASRVAQADNCAVAVGGGFASFDYGDTTVLARLIDEPYPNYEAVIPKENDRLLSINRQSMLQAVKRVALYSSTMTHQIRLSLKENQIEFSAEDIERASEARETVLCEYSDEPMDIGFNSVYLTEVISNLDADELAFKFSSPNRAGVIEPSNQSEDEDVLMLIMPVMLTPAYS